MTVKYAALQQWTSHNPDLLTVGIRDAYQAGAELVIPVGGRVLGWVMAK